MKFNISRALKEKNRISGKIAKLQKQVEEFNTYEEGKVLDLSSIDLLGQLQEEWAYLIDLKTKIAMANIGIADKLIKLTEAKSELAFWNQFRNSGPAVEATEKSEYREGKHVIVPCNKYSCITSKEILDHRDRVQKLIENLQDEIDDYNAQTLI
jgi:hypothetical protein